MVSYQLSAPEKFNFRNPGSWQTWLQRFERSRSASKLSQDSDDRQIDSLIYAMGKQADDILKSLSLNDEQSKSYEAVKKALTEHFVVRRNVRDLTSQLIHLSQHSIRWQRHVNMVT